MKMNGRIKKVHVDHLVVSRSSDGRSDGAAVLDRDSGVRPSILAQVFSGVLQIKKNKN